MPLKLNISNKGKAWKLEVDSEVLSGRSVGDVVKGEDINSDLSGYELQITGGSDLAGFPLSKDVEGIGLRRLLLKKGFAMKDNRKGVRRRKTVRGRVISEKVVQVNLNVLKEGGKKLDEIFPDQNKSPEAEGSAEKTEAPAPAQ